MCVYLLFTNGNYGDVGVAGNNNPWVILERKCLCNMYLFLAGRIGGRILTEQLEAVDGTKDFWDLGGEWVGRYVINAKKKFFMVLKRIFCLR